VLGTDSYPNMIRLLKQRLITSSLII